MSRLARQIKQLREYYQLPPGVSFAPSSFAGPEPGRDGLAYPSNGAWDDEDDLEHPGDDREEQEPG